MIKNQKIVKGFTFLLLAAVLWSCNSESEDEFELVGEVITLKKEIDGKIKYAPAYYAYGNKKMTSATVITPDDDDVVLSGTSSQAYTFYKEPADSVYISSVPSSGTYSFIVVNDDTKYYDTESHTTSSLDIPEIDTVFSSVSDNTLEIKWENNSDADYYVVRVFDDQDAIFVSYLQSSTDTICEVSSSTGSFDASLTEGNTYTANVQALVFDSDATSSDYYYCINTIAIATKEFVWE